MEQHEYIQVQDAYKLGLDRNGAIHTADGYCQPMLKRGTWYNLTQLQTGKVWRDKHGELRFTAV